jgi:hypothetical protein
VTTDLSARSQAGPGGKSLEKQGFQSPSSTPPSASACEPYREIIELAVSRGRNAMAIWQDLVSQYGFSGAYQTVKRFVASSAAPKSYKP